MKTLTSVIKAFLLASVVLLWGKQVAFADGGFLEIDIKEGYCQINDDGINEKNTPFSIGLNGNSGSAHCFFKDSDPQNDYQSNAKVPVDRCKVETPNGDLWGSGVYQYNKAGVVHVWCDNLHEPT